MARCQMPESMYWIKPVSCVVMGIRLRCIATGPSRLCTSWARSRRPSRSSTKSNCRQTPTKSQGDWWMDHRHAIRVTHETWVLSALFMVSIIWSARTTHHSSGVWVILGASWWPGYGNFRVHISHMKSFFFFFCKTSLNEKERSGGEKKDLELFTKHTSATICLLLVVTHRIPMRQHFIFIYISKRTLIHPRLYGKSVTVWKLGARVLLLKWNNGG